MAESMQGLKRTHRCGELSAANVGETVTIMGWGAEKQEQGRTRVYRCARPFRYHSGCV